MSYFWIFFGGGLGSIARFAFAGFIDRQFGGTFPWGTLLVNISGSFAIGLVGTPTQPSGGETLAPNFRTFFMVGVCGGYTTFSSFSLQTLSLARNGEWLSAGANCVFSLVLCLFAVWLGHVLALKLGSA